MKSIIFRIILIGCLLLTSLFMSGTAFAQDEGLPDPGITPDSPFYFIDTLGKNLGMFFTFGPEAKARKALKYAEERLAEARAMAVKNRIREMERASNDYDGFMAMVNQRLEEAGLESTSDNLSETIALAVRKHTSVLDRVKDEFPEQAGGAITRARNASMNGQINALRVLADVKPERAFDINLEAIEDRLERARVKATENMTAEVEEALDYAARLAEIEEEMTAIAEEKGIDITAIEQRLAQSTANRLGVLSGVYEILPRTARPAIEDAIGNSVRKYERTVETLKEKNALGEIPEEDAILQTIQEEVRERLQLQTSNQAQNSGDTKGQARIQVEVRETVQENIQEQTQNPEPESSATAVSTNQTSANQTSGSLVREYQIDKPKKSP